MCMILGCANIQENLNKAQATLVVGPLLVSPVKALFSTAQLIAGLAGTIFFGTLSALTSNHQLKQLTKESVVHLALGTLHLIYSILNFLSLGVIGYQMENPSPEESTRNRILVFALMGSALEEMSRKANGSSDKTRFF